MFFSFSANESTDDVGQVFPFDAAGFIKRANNGIKLNLHLNFHLSSTPANGNKHQSSFWFRIFSHLMDMKDKAEQQKEHFELYGEQNKGSETAIVVCQPCPRSFNYNHHSKSFLPLGAFSVRKFFHSRVEMNAENDVIKFQRHASGILCNLLQLFQSRLAGRI